jgi:hypothetical protein
MRFMVSVDERTVLAFEPTGAEYVLEPAKKIFVEWFSGTDPGMVALESGKLVIWAQGGGYTRAWDLEGNEIYIGPESGDNSL